ncbi:Rho guanine nucleotide exchange factor 3 [Aphelenchoides besseyi]|nr:Rho guanine nucleotide exchange factor 3 [Aphelenchoides besseyi]
MRTLPPRPPNRQNASSYNFRSSDSFEHLMSVYGLHRTPIIDGSLSAEFRLLTDDFDYPNSRSYKYDPVLIAASSHTHLHLLNRPCTSGYRSPCTPPRSPTMRRRSSLVEALNNSLLETYFPNEDEEREQEDRLKMLRHRRVTPSQRPGKFPLPSDDHQPPRALLRSYPLQLRERRARSQPLQQLGLTAEISDDELPRLPTHVSRADACRFSVESSSADSGIRSSTHSNSSAATTSCSISSGDERTTLPIAEAVYDHLAMMADELPFRCGDTIKILDSSPGPLWFGATRDRTGWFPSSYVRLRAADKNRLNSTLISATPASSDDLGDDETEDYPKSMRYQRRRVVEELLSTERDYVTLLRNLVEGFIDQCRRRPEMFPEDRVRRVFSNLEQILLLHSKILRELELAFDQNTPENSCISNAFVRNNQSFSAYTEYCNNRPISCQELAQLESSPQFHHFFEACRLLRGMPKLSLEGFLLTPVQRICRYPMQLSNLLKSTPNSHPDRFALEQAHDAMHNWAKKVDESRRRIEAIQKIILWQRSVLAFRGPDLFDNNSRMLISGELHCRAVMRGTGSGGVQWTKTVHVFLFDQSIVLCKKDVLKKSILVFKERMSLQCTGVFDMPDGKDQTLGTTLRNCFKLVGPTRTYYFTTTDPATKQIWLDHFRSRPRAQPPSNAEKRLALLTLNS